MFDTTTLITYAAACFIVAIIPGPNVTLTISAALSRGMAAGLAVVAGTVFGIFTMVFVVAIGLEALVAFMGWAFDWIKLAGAAYLIYLGIAMVRSSGKLEQSAEVAPKSLWRLSVQGCLVLWSNPKALIFFGAFIPQFVDVGQPAFSQIMVLGFIFMLVVAMSDGAYAVLAGSARHVLTTARIKFVSRISGVILMCGGIWLAMAKRS